MARFYRRGYGRYGRRLGRRYFRFRRYRYRLGYGRKYVNGSSKSTIRMKCNTTFSGSSQSGHGSTLGDVKAILPYATANATAVVNSPLYQAYCNLYEETKLIGFKTQLSVTSVVGNATLPSLQIWTSFDRRAGYLEPEATAAEIQSAASSNVATALNNNVAKITRSIYASDLMEKAQWHDSTIGTVNGVNGDVAWLTAGLNPNFFCPRLDFCFGSPALAANTTVNWTISTTYYVAFRNPKYGGSGSSKELPTKSVTIPDTPADVADMIADDDLDADGLIDDILDIGANMEKNASEGANARRAILNARREARKKRVPVTSTNV